MNDIPERVRGARGRERQLGQVPSEQIDLAVNQALADGDLFERLTILETKVEERSGHWATKEYVQEAVGKQTRWMVGIGVAVVGAAVTALGVAVTVAIRVLGSSP